VVHAQRPADRKADRHLDQIVLAMQSGAKLFVYYCIGWSACGCWRARW
jgi:hypothetical protein